MSRETQGPFQKIKKTALAALAAGSMLVPITPARAQGAISPNNTEEYSANFNFRSRCTGVVDELGRNRIALYFGVISSDPNRDLEIQLQDDRGNFIARYLRRGMGPSFEMEWQNNIELRDETTYPPFVSQYHLVAGRYLALVSTYSPDGTQIDMLFGETQVSCP
jgi:hypothetical protein